jgi:hypothetical protein
MSKAIDRLKDMLEGQSIVRVVNTNSSVAVEGETIVTLGPFDEDDKNYVGPIEVTLSNGMKLSIWSSEYGAIDVIG